MSDDEKPSGNASFNLEDFDTPSNPESLSNAMKRVREAMEPVGASARAMAALTGANEMKRISESIEKSMAPFRDMQERMRSLAGGLGTESAVGKLASQIADQQRLIDSISRPATDPMLDRIAQAPAPLRFPTLPPNPIFETNERLGKIEGKFDQLHVVAAQSASIANGLQGAATEFLTDFKTASRDNDRAAKKAIWLGVIALFVAVVCTLGQVAYEEFWRAPADSQSAQSALAELKVELEKLRREQDATALKLADALERSDDDLAAAIRSLIEQLGTPKDRDRPDGQ